MNLDRPAPSTPRLWRIAEAAAAAGISADLLERGILAGQIPVKLVVLGRMRYVLAVDMAAWLRESGAPTVDLFAGSPQ